MIEKPHGRIEFEGTVTFPERGREIIREIAKEIPPKPIPWGWLVAAGALFVTAIICLSID